MSDRIDILLVDDEPRNLDALEAILVDPSYRLLRAEDANTALKLLLDHEVAAIVLDIKMPGTSGFELAQMIKATRRYRQIPILFLTAYLVEDQDVLAGYGAGAVDYLTKPLNPQIVRHKVAVFADLFRKTRALAELNEKLEERVKARTSELERSEAALRETDHKKDEFIAVLAHELRNPLAPLRFGLDILAKQLPNANATVTKTMATMNRQLDHMVRLIDDLLDVSRVSRGVIELKRERCDLAAVIEGAIEGVRPIIEQHRHQLSRDLDKSALTFGDSTRLAQIIGNLLHNAAKFTADGGRISVELERDGNQAVVRVTDTGHGIPPDQIEHAFEMFARIGAGGRPPGRGLGIGLALARRLAQLHGGTLTASSDGPDRGTTFTLRLPIAQDLESITQRKPNGAPATATKELNIVVIEDTEDVADTLSAVLEAMGHHVSVAYSGESGLALVEEKRPQVVLCDLGLPKMDGVEVCRRVRRLALETQPVMVALTGWGREADRRRTQEAGFDDHLVKPIAAEQLRVVLESVTGVD